MPSFRSDEFTPRQCADLYRAVEHHDEIDVAATLPGSVHLDYDRDQLARCYRICRQLWVGGVDRRAFVRIVGVARRDALSPDDIVAFRHIRAKFKQLRFAYGMLGETHRYPRMFDWTTQTMGRLQDGIRNHDRAAVVRNAVALRLLLAAIPYRLIRREIDGFGSASTAGFQGYVRAQIDLIAAALSQPETTGKDFHRLRKIVSRQVAFYDTLGVLYPSAYHAAVGRYLGTINGMMGALHDDLVAAKLRDPLAYHAQRFALPDGIRVRLDALVQAHRAGAADRS